jgi:hypothetical protein
MLSASARAACATGLPRAGSSASLRAAARAAPLRRASAPTSRRAMGGAQASAAPPDGLSDGCKGAPAAPGAKLPLMADESLMAPKAHGTAATPVQSSLRWGCDAKLADRICWCVARRGGGRHGGRRGRCTRRACAALRTAPHVGDARAHLRRALTRDAALLRASPRLAQLQPPLRGGARVRGGVAASQRAHEARARVARRERTP